MTKIIIYDFDGTLTPNPVADFEILEKCGYNKPTKNVEYINKVNKKIDEDNMNIYEAVYTTFLETIKDANIEVSNENISLGANNFEYNEGVLEFLDYTKSNNIKNYIVSSSLKVLLDKTEVAPFFDEIYATTFKYNDKDEAYAIDYLLTDVEKVNVIKKILKANNLNNCNNVIYIGDGLTDYYAMEYVRKNGGDTIYICYDKNDKNIDIMKRKNVVSLFSDANYSKESKIYKYINNLFKL